MPPEQPVEFTNASGQLLVGVWHPAAEGDAAKSTILMLHGWSGYRSGPHQMLTRAARAFAAAGHNVLRFDFAGRGDSEGDALVATLATMREDAIGALAWCREQGGGGDVVLLGLCSGCEVALATATEPGVEALALWSAPVFAAAESSARSARKRSDILRQYARKLLRPATWAKLLGGKLDTGGIRKAVKAEGGGGKNVEADAPGKIPRGWRDAALKRYESFTRPLLLIYGTADPDTVEALAWHRKTYRGEPQVGLVEGANHSYYGLAWEREVIAHTAQWLDSRGKL